MEQMPLQYLIAGRLHYGCDDALKRRIKTSEKDDP